MYTQRQTYISTCKIHEKLVSHPPPWCFSGYPAHCSRATASALSKASLLAAGCTFARDLIPPFNYTVTATSRTFHTLALQFVISNPFPLPFTSLNCYLGPFTYSHVCFLNLARDQSNDRSCFCAVFAEAIAPFWRCMPRSCPHPHSLTCIMHVHPAAQAYTLSTKKPHLHDTSIHIHTTRPLNCFSEISTLPTCLAPGATAQVV
jgi:hypothetical protein